jgi:competence protein ComEA
VGSICERLSILSQKERKCIVGLIILIAIIVVLPHFFSSKQTLSIIENDILKNAIDSSQSSIFNSVNDSEDFDPPLLELSLSDTYENASLFNFDPNTLSVEGWQKLGLKEKTIKTINNYRIKGGKFYKPEDLKKIWGLDISFYERVKDYIVIPQKENMQYETKQLSKAGKKIVVVLDINTADSAELIVLPGIGPRLSARIVSFQGKIRWIFFC